LFFDKDEMIQLIHLTKLNYDNYLANSMNKYKIALFAIPVLAAVLIGSSFSPAFAGLDHAFSETINTSTYHELYVDVPCANDGSGETVHLEGYIQDVFHITENQNGYTVFQTTHPQGLSGYGLITGDSYQGTGVTRYITNSDDVLTDTFVNNFRIIGQGNGNNFLVHTTSHFTNNANGDLTANVIWDRIECK
jgi:hypothetical protein